MKENEIQDPNKDRLQELIMDEGRDAHQLLAEYSIFDSLSQIPAFKQAVEAALQKLDHKGSHTTVKAYLAGSGTN